MGAFDLSRGITGWFAEKTLKWSGLIAMDRANKAAFGLLMYKNIGELTRKFKTLDDVKGQIKPSWLIKAGAMRTGLSWRRQTSANDYLRAYGHDA
jgi:hypothetical protein